MASKHNIFNVVFVKWGWLWTLSLVTPFVVLTSYTYSCGTMDLVRKHVTRSVGEEDEVEEEEEDEEARDKVS